MSLLITIEGIDGAGKTTAQNALTEVVDNPVLTTEPNDSEGYNEKWNTVDWFGEQVRNAISTDETHPLSVLFFFLADHAHHYENTIKPALNDGNNVICDRYIGSRYAYQSLSLNDMINGDSLSYLSTLHESELNISNQDANMIFNTAEDKIPQSLYSETPEVGKYLFGLAHHPETYPEKLTHPTDDFIGLSVDESADASWSQKPNHTILLDLPVDEALNRISGSDNEVFEKREFLTKVRKQYLSVADRKPQEFTVIDATQSIEVVSQSVQNVVLDNY